jgi:hypothetical protein
MRATTTTMSTTLLVFAVLLSLSVVSASKFGDDACRSNHTHIAWRSTDDTKATADIDTDIINSAASSPTKDTNLAMLGRSRRMYVRGDAPDSSSVTCRWQTRAEAERDAYQFLRQHVMTFDLPFLETLGFDDDNDGKDMPDGLSGGLIGPTIQYALESKIQFRHTDALPLEMWQEYVLNYANLNEGRTNWRALLWNKLRVLVHQDDTVQQAVESLNTNMWKMLAPSDTDCITFVSSETPLIFDPMSVLVFGHASCTGLAVLFTNALRAVGVPARVVGTPAWYQDRESGNHNWVEVWNNVESSWKFLEPSPNQTVVYTLDRNPCERWFCSRTRFNYQTNTTLVAAARLRSVETKFFRLAWEWNNADVPAQDMSDFYRHTCSQCP